MLRFEELPDRIAADGTSSTVRGGVGSPAPVSCGNPIETWPVKGTKKQHLPEKACATCGRPFAWRKKWERVWDEVKYCSDRCRMRKGKGSPG